MTYSFRAGSLVVCLVLIVLTAVSQTTPLQADKPASPPAAWLDHWRSSCFSFGELKKDDQNRNFFKAIGTGCTLAIDGHHGYIITAKHVFYDPTKDDWHPYELRVRYQWEEKKSVYEDLGAVLTLRDKDGKDLWVGAPDGSDVAATNIVPQSTLGVKTQEAIFLSQLAGEEDVFEGATVIVLGYPGIVGNEYLVKPIARGGIVAWLDPADPINKPFLIDANIYPGNSGGPVIRIPTGLTREGAFSIGGKTTLLGLVSKAPGQSQDITVQVPGLFGRPTPLTLHQEIPLGGTGIIEPAASIRKLVTLLSSGAKKPTQ